jgi:hypothetical protein
VIRLDQQASLSTRNGSAIQIGARMLELAPPEDEEILPEEEALFRRRAMSWRQACPRSLWKRSSVSTGLSEPAAMVGPNRPGGRIAISRDSTQSFANAS